MTFFAIQKLNTKTFFRAGLFFACLLLLLFSQKAMASFTLHMPLEDLSKKASVIVHTKVFSFSAAWEDQGKRIWTTYQLEVKSLLKGEFNADAIAHARGGTVGNKTQIASGQPYLETGKEYLLFLWYSEKSKRYLILGSSQGVFKVTQENDGETWAENSYQGIHIINRDGEEIDAEKLGPIREKLEDLKTSIANSLALPEQNALKTEDEDSPEEESTENDNTKNKKPSSQESSKTDQTSE